MVRQALRGWLGVVGVVLGMMAPLAGALVVLVGLPAALWLYWRGKPGFIQKPRRFALLGLVGLLVLFMAWLVLNLDFSLRRADSTYVLQLGLAELVLFAAFAERAAAECEPDAVEGLVGAMGGCLAALPFWDPGLGLAAFLATALAFIGLVALQALRLRRATRFALAVGTVPAALGLEGFLGADLWVKVAAGALVVGYAVALWWFLPRLPAPRPKAPAG